MKHRLSDISSNNNILNCMGTLLYYILTNDTPIELHIFWQSDTECRIRLTFSESVSLSLKTRLMTLLVRSLQKYAARNVKCPRVIKFKIEFLLV